jgi:hypothetical protein
MRGKGRPRERNLVGARRGSYSSIDKGAPAGTAPGDRYGGEICLGVDPFFYFETLAQSEGAPALIYDWRIEKVEMQMAPFIKARPNHFERDPDNWSWREIDQTNASEDDGGHALYRLHCARSDAPPRKNR